ncbi:DUF721 domain-containing protein [Patulibacter sp. S7RM1-6]
MPRRRRLAPRAAGEALPALVDGLAPEDAPDPALLRLQRTWRIAMPAAVAKAGSPVALRDGVLLVACRDATWAQELQMLERMLLERLVAAGLTDVTAVRTRAGADR